MADEFLGLSSEDRAAILGDAANKLGRSAQVLEKDVWVCCVLEHLFTMPGRKPMAFKGGTSLSKVFNAISRFSEDVDVTLDYRGLEPDADPFAARVSKSRLKKLGDELKEAVTTHVVGHVVPGLRSAFAGRYAQSTVRIEVSQNGEEVRFFYPSAVEPKGGYVGSSVLIEFGGRNITEPSQEHRIFPDLTEHYPEVTFPAALVNVLAPERTFWEKATLIHVECNRDQFRKGADRLSRHWYDLVMLAKQEIGRKALADRNLLADVVKHKKVFFDASFAHYDECLTGHIRLVPGSTMVADLEADYRQMVTAGMFYGDPPPAFQEILAQLRELESAINSTG